MFMVSAGKLLYLSEEDERRVDLPMDRVMDILEEVHLARRRGRVQQPPKPGLRPVGTRGFIDGYPAFVEGTDYLGIKWLSGYFSNPPRGLPFIQGLILLNDPDTGAPVCVMGCGYVTALRTAGMNGIGLRRLAASSVKTIGVIGCGLQGRTNLRAALAACPGAERVLCWNIRRPGAERYAAEMAAVFPRLSIRTTETAEETVRSAEVLIIGAPLEPDGSARLIRGEWLPEGVTIAAVNGDSSFCREALSRIDRVFVDDENRYEERKRAGMLDAALPEGCDELGALLEGACEGRRDPKERILITAEGMAINDVSCARAMYEAALAQGIGTFLPL